MKILALDVATKTGFATATGSGVWDLTPKRDESKGMRLIRFKKKLMEIHEVESIDVLVFEMSAGFHKSSIAVQSELHGVMKVFCEENEIDYRSYSAPQIKKHATGKGNANKAAMVAAAKEQFPHITIIDDNHADALFMYDLAVKDLV